MAGASPRIPTIEGMRILLTGTEALDDPSATVLRLCLQTLCLPWEAVDIDLHRIDWSSQTVPVPARGGRERLLVLPNAAIRTLQRVAGSATGRGQAVTAGRGRPITHRDIRLDRLRERMGAVAPATLRVDWNFHGLRVAGATALRAAGTPVEEISGALGLFDRRPRKWSWIPLPVPGVLERWNRMLASETAGRTDRSRS